MGATAPRWKRRTAIGLCVAAGLAILAGGVVAGLLALDRAFPPPLAEKPVSTEVVDRNGAILRAYPAADGAWRMPVDLAKLDPTFVEMLVAYEDRRFRTHRGVDPLAVLRAAGQLVTNGRIVSGGSTITMQLARLMEPRESRSLVAKLRQALRALQIERRLTKDEILARYLTLAPYGGNLEGVRAASHAWFGKEPHRLTLSEAALLVALPQSPEARRPDRNPQNAESARARVLERMTAAGLIEEAEVERALAVALPAAGRREMPALAAHAADLRRRAEPDADRIATTLDAGVQAALERVAREAAPRIGSKVSVAMVMADARTGALLAEVGAPDFRDNARAGWVDMTRAVRSPGSTLKPFIYGLAFEEGLVAQQTMIEDKPASFSGYRPKNFDMAYMGDVTVREALQLSLNVPAIRLLDAVGPVRLTTRMQQAGVRAVLPAAERPGLAIGLGGAGMTLRDLVQLYTGIANGGFATTLRNDPSTISTASRLLEPVAAWQVTDVLAGVRPPQGSRRLPIGYKTGTSYGYRDAWAVGFDGRHVLGVWVGRPDGGPVPGIAGLTTAAPLVFEGFVRAALPPVPFPSPPAGAVRLPRGELPVTQRRFRAPMAQQLARSVVEAAPEIVFPVRGARLEMSGPDGSLTDPLTLKLQGGRAPFRWLANGRPLDGAARRRTAQWTPPGKGFSTLTVIDAAGRAASVGIYIE